MGRNFIPGPDQFFVAWSLNLSQRINATPTAFGLTAPQAAAYETLHEAFAAALQTASEPVTRTRGAIETKNEKRRLVEAEARVLARIINAFPGTSNTARIDLGLTPRDEEPTPINPPSFAPQLTIDWVLGRRAQIRAKAPGHLGRGRPEGVDGITIVTYTGEAPPDDLSLWRFEGSTTKLIMEVEVPASVPVGSRVWYSAFFFNPRKESGPSATPVSLYVSGGLASQAA